MNRRLFLSAIVAPLALRAAPVPALTGGAVVLGDSGDISAYIGTNDDHLTFFDGQGRVIRRVTGLNTLASGGSRAVAVDAERAAVWVGEVRGRLLRYDLRGSQLLAVNGVKPTAVAVDPKTGNAWVACSLLEIGTGHVDVYSPRGVRLARHPVPGHDIVFDPAENAFWVVAK
ncbi:MAG: hypothetical protein ACRC33_00225, partial [Gemmataceae bacterium]